VRAVGLYVEGLVSEGAVTWALPPQLVALAFQTFERLVDAVDAPGYVGYSRTLLQTQVLLVPLTIFPLQIHRTIPSFWSA